MSTANHPAFESADQEILAKLVDQGEDANEATTGQPSETTTDAPAQATATEAAPATPAPALPSAAPVAAVAPAAAPAEATPAVATAPTPPQGDTRAALRAARHAEKRMRDEVERLSAENETLRKQQPATGVTYTEEQLAEIEQDSPIQAQLLRDQKALKETVENLKRQQQQATQPAAEFEAPSYDPDIQEVIDGVPQLVAWQYDPAAQVKFARAIEYDKALMVDPDWKDRSIADRFTEAARRSDAAFSPAPAPAPTPAAPAAPANRVDPATQIANAPVEGPKGISDFRGGAPGHTPTLNYSGMSDEAIMASLPVS